jgi:hypothetical protein
MGAQLGWLLAAEPQAHGSAVPPGLPSVVHRELASSRLPAQATTPPANMDAALKSLEERYIQISKKFSTPADRPSVARPSFSVTRCRTEALENPYLSFASEILRNERQDNTRLRVLVERPLNQNERKEFASAFGKVDATKLVAGDMSDADVRTVRKYVGQKRFAHLERTTLGLLGGLAKEVGKGLVVDRFKELIVGNPSKETLKLVKELEEKYFIDLKRQLQEQGEKLDFFGQKLENVEALAQKADRNTMATLATQWMLLYYTVHTTTELQKGIQGVQDSQEETLETIKKGSAQIKAGLGQNRALVQKNVSQTYENGLKLDLMMSGLYDSLPTAEKIAWLKNPAFNIPEDRRKDEVTKQERVRLSEEFDHYFSTAGKIVQGLDALGVDKEVLKVADAAITKGSQATQIFKAIAKGDFFGAIGGVFGLIFGGGPDPAEIRHEEVMKGLKAIQENQQKIYDKIVDVERQIIEVRRQLAEVMDAVRDVDRKVCDVYKLLHELADRDLKNLEILLNDLEQHETYEGKVKYFGQPGKQATFDDGFKELRRRFSSAAGRPNDEFGLPSPIHQLTPAQGEKFAAYLRDFVAPHFRLAAKVKLDEKWLVGLAAISRDVLDLEGKLKSIREDRFVAPHKVTVEQFTRFLDAPLVARDVELALRTIPYRFYQVTATAQPKVGGAIGQLMTKKQMFQPGVFDDVKQRRADCENLLRGTLDRLTVALAQQALLCGDILLNEMYADPDASEAREVLRTNAMAASNLGLLAARRTALNNYSYTTFFSFQNAFHWQRAFEPWKHSVEFRREADGWLMGFSKSGNAPSVDIPLPLPGAFVTGEFEQFEIVERLRHLRVRVIDLIADLEFSEQLGPKEYQLLTDIYAWDSANHARMRSVLATPE